MKRKGRRAKLGLIKPAGVEPETWTMLTAARGGQRGKMVQLLAADPGRVQLEYSYTRPLHFAVREGHLHIDCAVADGASLTALTVIDTVAAEEVDVPSETVNVKLSAPL